MEIKTPPNISLPKVNLVDDVNKLYISALQPTASQGIVRVSGLAEFAGWEVRQFSLICDDELIKELFRILVLLVNLHAHNIYMIRRFHGCHI